jgi:protein-disulfide isomerase
MKNQKALITGAVVLIIAIFIGGASLYKKNKSDKLEFMSTENAQVFVRKYSPTMGPDDAKVYLVEFLDPECESCRAFYPFVKKIMKQHEGKIKLVVRYAPFHHNSVFVVKILEAARKQGKYWETLELLFRHQPKWGSHQSPQPELIWGYLPTIGLDVAKIKKDMLDPAIDKMLEQEVADAKTLGIRQTPSFFINGKPLTSFGYEQLTAAIESAINEH